MTSEEIKNSTNLLIWEWLREIAYQLAVENEQRQGMQIDPQNYYGLAGPVSAGSEIPERGRDLSVEDIKRGWELFYDLWGDAQDRLYIKRKWQDLQCILELQMPKVHLSTRAEPYSTPSNSDALEAQSGSNQKAINRCEHCHGDHDTDQCPAANKGLVSNAALWAKIQGKD